MLTLNTQPLESPRDQRIREEFKLHQVSLAAFTHHCDATGFWTDEESNAYAFRSKMQEVRRALRHHTANGLPFAGQTAKKDDDGSPIWAQRTLWSLDDYGVNIRELKTQSETLIAIAEEMIREASNRYGVNEVARILREPALAA